MRGFVVLACALSAAPALGDILISNFSAAALPSGTFFGTGSGTISKAVGFTIGPQAYTLGPVSLTMNFGGGGAAVVSIWQGAPAPSLRLVTLNSPPQTGSGNFTFSSPAPLTLQPGTTYWVFVESVGSPAGSFMWEGTTPSTAPSGAATYVGFLFNGAPSATLNRIEVQGTPVGATCYANCDGSTGQPRLTANDFACFLAKYAAGDTYANCDGSTGQPTLTANDFACFLSKYAAGCS